MREIIEAIFDNGSFKPIGNQELLLSQGQRVKLTVETRVETQDDLIELAGKVYEGLSDQEIAEIEEIALARNNFSSREIAG